MKNIAIFGASGVTGVCVVEAALSKGLNIRALLRNPSKLPNVYREKVDVVKGDVLNILDVKSTLEGQDGVIVALGTRNDLGPTTVMSEGLKNIIAVMEALQIKVISVCLSMYLFCEPEKVPTMYYEINTDHQRMYNALKDSDLHWIAVNTSSITDQPPTGYFTRQGANTRCSTISKYDLARFLVDCLFMPEHYQKAVGIASNPRR